MGEKAGTRERIDNLVGQLVRSGAPAEYAKQKARQAAIRDDRKNTKNK